MFYLYVHFKDSFGTEDHFLPPKTMFWRFRAHMRLMQNCVWKNQIWGTCWKHSTQIPACSTCSIVQDWKISQNSLQSTGVGDMSLSSMFLG